MKFHYVPEVYDSQDAPELEGGYYAVLLEEDANVYRDVLTRIARWVQLAQNLELSQNGALQQIKIDVEQALK